MQLQALQLDVKLLHCSLQQAAQQPELLAIVTAHIDELVMRIGSLERWNTWGNQTTKVAPVLQPVAPKNKAMRRLRVSPEQEMTEMRICISASTTVDCAIQGCAQPGTIEFSSHRSKLFCEYHADTMLAGHVRECLADDCDQLMVTCNGTPIYRLWDTEGCLCARHVKLQWPAKFACPLHHRRLKQPHHRTCTECVKAGIKVVL